MQRIIEFLSQNCVDNFISLISFARDGLIVAVLIEISTTISSAAWLSAMKTKFILILSLFLAVMTGRAPADDLRMQKPPETIAVGASPWAGFYAGLNAGYSWGVSGEASTQALPIFDAVAPAANAFDPINAIPGTALRAGNTALASAGAATLNPAGFIGGGQIGYNWLFDAREAHFIAGVEADFQGATIGGSGRAFGASQDSVQFNDGPGVHPCGPAINCVISRLALGAGEIKANLDWLGTVRARMGYLVTPTTMIYGTGGLAYGGARNSTNNSALTLWSVSNLNAPFDVFNGTLPVPAISGANGSTAALVGWAAGGGLEWMFAQGWSLKIEGLYYNLGSFSSSAGSVNYISPITLSIPPLGAATGLNVAAGQLLMSNAVSSRVRYDGVIARAGLNYHFDLTGAPAIERF